MDLKKKTKKKLGFTCVGASYSASERQGVTPVEIEIGMDSGKLKPRFGQKPHQTGKG